MSLIKYFHHNERLIDDNETWASADPLNFLEWVGSENP